MGASPRFGSRSAQPGGGVSMLHLLGYLILLVTGFQAGRMACSWGELGGDVSMDSPATQRAILSRINRLERLAEAAALANPALATAAGLARTDDPAERDARRLRKLAATPAGSGGVPHGRCRDKLEKCADWAAAGECKRNGAYMRETCPKSCDFCAVASGSGGSAAAGGGGGAGSGETGPDGCPANRRPFHVIQTADSSTYQQWQSRMMYYHFLKQQKADPCSEMGGFTRLLNTFDGGCDDLCDEMPTFSVRRMVSGADHAECDCDWTTVLNSPRCLCDASLPSCDCPLDTLRCNFAQCGDMGFVVLNRPYGVLQFLQSDEWKRRIVEDYVIIAETDHLYMRTLPNRATATVPVGYQFGYMNAAEPKLCAAAKPYWSDCSVVDPVGPSPVIMHRDQLAKLTPHWFALSMALKRDPAADKAYGWVLEMWGYTLAAARMRIRHSLWPNIQVEPSALWHCDDSFTEADYYTFHFTYGLEYSLKGHPSSKVGEWSLNKRNYMGAFPPKDLAPPPKCAGACAHRLWSLFSEAANNLPNWPAGGRGTLGWVKPLAAEDFDASAPAARALVGTGPWSWRGRKYYFLQDGLFLADPPSALAGAPANAHAGGTWKAKPASGARSTLRVELEGCGERCVLTMAALSDGQRADAFDADCTAAGSANIEESSGTLAPVPAAVSARFASSRAGASPELMRRVEGSGPWSWDGVESLFFLHDGRLVTPWDAGGEWRYTEDGAGVYANFVGEEHTLSFNDCLAFSVVRKRDKAKSKGLLTQPEIDPAHCRLDG